MDSQLMFSIQQKPASLSLQQSQKQEKGQLREQAQLTIINLTVIEKSSADPSANSQHSNEDNATDTPAVPEVPYSIFTAREKRLLVALAALAALFSPLSANIYFAATTTLAANLNISLSDINLTITTYLIRPSVPVFPLSCQIFQGLAPTVVGSLSDTLGRRPLYIACFVVYICANIGLARSDSFAVLLVLRCVQSSGSSGTTALANALVSDIVTSAHRGSYISYVSMGSVLGPSFGPIIGGLLSHYINWQAIFWFLAIFSGVTFFIILAFLPETCRKVVGNGSITAPKWDTSLWAYYKLKKDSRKGFQLNPETRPTKKVQHSLFQSIHVMLDKESGIVLLFSGICGAGYYMVITGIPSQLDKSYGYDALKIGLCYIPAGLGSALSALIMGRFLDWNFKRTAKAHGLELSGDRQQDLRGFPIEAARLQAILPMICLPGASVLAFGWIMQHRVMIAGPLIFLFLATFSISCSFQGLSTLIVDLNRDRPSSATAAMNLARCWLGAAASGLVVPLLNLIGIGWTCVLVTGIWAMMSPVVLLVIRLGPVWREEKKKKEDERSEAMSEV